MKKDARIFVAGRRGMVGSALVRRLRAGSYFVNRERPVLVRAAHDIGVAGVAHEPYRELSTDDCAKLIKGGFIDVKAGFDDAALTAADIRVWRL